MQFTTPKPGVTFEIPDDWWTFTEMAQFGGFEMGYYPPSDMSFEVLDLNEIEPPQRSPGVPLFKKYKLVPVLLAFHSPECALPSVQVIRKTKPGRYSFTVHNGVHRFYASVAAGIGRLPVRICTREDLGLD
jgi:hypothetical protein